MQCLHRDLAVIYFSVSKVLTNNAILCACEWKIFVFEFYDNASNASYAFQMLRQCFMKDPFTHMHIDI